MGEEEEDKIRGDNGRDERRGGEAITCTGETERIYKIGVVITSVTVVMEGGCETEGDGEIKECFKHRTIVISERFRHMQGFIPTRDARQPSMLNW